MELEQVAMTDFVLLQAEWPVAKGRDLIEALPASHVVVYRREESDEYYYLFTAAEACSLLRSAPEPASVGEALDLHEWRAVPAQDAVSNADTAPDRCVVLSDGQITGYFDVTEPPVLTRTRGNVPQGPASPAEPLPDPIARRLEAEFPDTVPLNETASLVVQLTAAEGTGTAMPILQRRGTVIDVVVQARRGFTIEGRAESSLTISDEEETLPLQFKLRATELGQAQIHVLAFSNGVALGKLTLAPTVASLPVASGTGDRSLHVAALAPVSIRMPDLSLLIEETRSNGSRGFCMRISASDPTANLNLAKFGPILFQTDPGPHFEAFYGDIENYPIRTAPEKAAAVLHLAGKGTYLFETLVPREARQKLWSLKDQIKTVLIQSEEPWIPWELCKLVGEESGEIIEGPFLCEAFDITRWMPGPALRPRLRLDNIAVVAPNDSGLPYASDERKFLLSLAGSSRQVTSVPARFLELQKAFTSGQYDAWHFTGHGGYRASDASRSVMYLENEEQLSPTSITGVVRNLGKTRPLVFLNACQIGRSGMSLTDIGGWARQFLLAGAGAFVGAYWSVYDQPAYQFAQELYTRLLAGVSMAQAVREARLAIKADGDPTWLAYTVFADPFATVQD